MGDVDSEILLAREKLKQRLGGGAAKAGGRGSARRKKKAVHKTSSSADDKKTQSTLKRLGVNQIPHIAEVVMFCEDGTVVRMDQPKLQASIQANTFVISGASKRQPLSECMADVAPMMGADNASRQLQTPEFQQQMASMSDGAGGVDMAKLREAMAAAGGAAGAPGATVTEEDDDDDVPDLVDNFEEVSEET